MSEYEDGQDPFTTQGSTENTTKEDAQKGGGGAGVTKEGFYHITVEAVSFKTEEGKAPHVLVQMKTLQGEDKVQDQIGKTIYHRIFPKPLDDEDKEQKRIVGLASFFFQMGVMTEEEAFGNPTFTVTRKHYENLEGCQAIVKVSKRAAREYEDKKDGTKKMGKESFEVWNNDVWNLSHEKVKDVPRDWEMAQLAGGGGGGSSQTADDLAGI